MSVTVVSGNTAPVADDDTLTTPEDVQGSVNVLDGDTDADGDTRAPTRRTPATSARTVGGRELRATMPAP